MSPALGKRDPKEDGQVSALGGKAKPLEYFFGLIYDISNKRFNGHANKNNYTVKRKATPLGRL